MYEGKHGWVYWVAHLQNRLLQKGDISKCLRKHTMRSGLSSPLTSKVTLLWTLSRIDKQCSQLHGISKGGAQCRLPCDFPAKSLGRIYFINVGMCFLMCSRKLCCVPDFCDFGDFCSWKRHFGVGIYGGGCDVYCTKIKLMCCMIKFCVLLIAETLRTTDLPIMSCFSPSSIPSIQSQWWVILQ